MNGDDLGAGWGSSGDDLGANWGAPAPVARKKAAPSRKPKGQEGARAQAAARAQTAEAEQNAGTTMAEAISPANVQAQREGRGIGAKQYASVKDLLTLPGRALFGAIQGAGELAGSRSMAKAFEAAKAGAASPSKSFEESAPFMPAVQRYLASPRQFAATAEDPLAIPGAALGASSVKPVAQGLLGTLAAYGRRQADAAASGQETKRGLQLEELAPTAAGAGVAALPVVGGAMQQSANQLFRKMVKPARAEVEGLTEALAAGKLPALAGWAGSVGEAGEQFLRKLGKIGEQYPEILAKADATGQKVSTAQAYSQARKDLVKAMADRKITLSPEESNEALSWLSSRIRLPESPEGISAVMRGRSWPANDIRPSLAHRLKSSLYDIAFGKEAEAAVPRAAKIALAKSASKDTRTQLGQISPEYAALNREAAPLYAAEDAMARAAEVRANNYHLGGLDVAGLGIPVLLRTPAFARGVWESGKAAERLAPLAKRLAPVVASPGDQLRLGQR